jgi:ATP-dependent RNA helicase DDX3X
MAEQLDMGRLNLNDSQHAPNGFNGERSAYIPPHLRGRPGGQAPPPMAGPPPMANGGAPGPGGNAWGPAPGGPGPAFVLPHTPPCMVC